MKKMRIFFILTMIFSLLIIFPSCAENKEYTVKFKENFIVPYETYEYLSVIKEEKNLFTTDNPEKLAEYSEFIERIYQNKEILMLEEAENFSLTSLPSDPKYSFQKHLKFIGADEGWINEAYGNNIKVGVIDSGCFPHSDLIQNIISGKNYIDNNENTTDTVGHGTHVSGIIAAAMNDIGGLGVAPKAKIIPLKCFDSKNGDPIDVINAIYDAVDVYNCRIINMSLGIKHSAISGQEWESDFKEAIDYAYEKGVIMIAATGNYGTKELCYPAAYDNVIGVGSVDFDKSKSSFSQYNSSVNVVAPGEANKIYSTYIKKTVNPNTLETEYTETYITSGGTSQAAPQVAGMAAVALSIKPELTFGEFLNLLEETSEDLGEKGWDAEFGYGLINIKNMINKLISDMEWYVSPVNLNGNTAKVLVKNNSGKLKSVTSIFVDYAKNKPESFVKTPITFNEDEQKYITVEFNGEKINHFLWENFETLNPLCYKR